MSNYALIGASNEFYFLSKPRYTSHPQDADLTGAAAATAAAAAAVLRIMLLRSENNDLQGVDRERCCF